MPAQLDVEAPPGWLSAIAAPLLVLAGVTGVGKSTTLERLARLVPCAFLPDRRELADRVVFPLVQAETGSPRRPVLDRVERFRLTARYRELHAGGLAHALSRLRIDPGAGAGDALLVFDGLRGEDELGWAAANLPGARFLALTAPEAVRLRRLLGRGEDFDHTELAAPVASSLAVESLLAAVPGLERVIARGDLELLLRDPEIGALGLEEIARKAAILVEEARNYDPRAAVRRLEAALPPARRLVVDTSVVAPDAVAERVVRWLRS